MRKSADLKKKSMVYDPTDCHVTPYDFSEKNQPTTTDFHIGVVGGKNLLV